MQLASVKRLNNVNLEDENPTAKGKKQVSDTPRRALGDMKNMATPHRSAIKKPAAIQKPGLQIVDSKFGSVETRARQSDRTHSTPSTTLHFDLDDDIIEECNLKEDPSIEETVFQRQNDIVLYDPENEAEYYEKLFSTECYGLASNSEDDETIETCGEEDDTFDWCHTMNNGDADVVLIDDFPSFPYERPDEDGLDKVKKYTLQEMEDLFDSFADVLIL